MTCKVCQSQITKIFSHIILKKYMIDYFQCNICGFIQTEAPYWIEEAYKNALNPDDTGLIKRNEYFREKASTLLFFLFPKNNKYIDYAGGYGLFTRMMRDIGFDFFWTDKYAQNIISKGFEDKPENKYQCVTAFEIFEHMIDPHEELEKILKYSDNIIFSTVLSGDHVQDQNWWYYGFNHGQHVSIYSEKSLKLLGSKFGLNFYTNGSNFHMFTKKRLSNFFFKLMIKLAKYGLYNFIKFNLTSKTDSDAQFLINQ